MQANIDAGRGTYTPVHIQLIRHKLQQQQLLSQHLLHLISSLGAVPPDSNGQGSSKLWIVQFERITDNTMMSHPGPRNHLLNQVIWYGFTWPGIGPRRVQSKQGKLLANFSQPSSWISAGREQIGPNQLPDLQPERPKLTKAGPKQGTKAAEPYEPSVVCLRRIIKTPHQWLHD